MKKECNEYFEDPDDPSIPNVLETLKFVEYDNYTTENDVVKFDLDYVIELSKINQNAEKKTSNIQNKETTPPFFTSVDHEKYSILKENWFKQEYEKIHGINSYRTLNEIEEEVDEIMEGIWKRHNAILKSEGLIQNTNFDNNVINETVEITRTIRKKLEDEVIETKTYFEDTDDPPIPNEFDNPRYVEKKIVIIEDFIRDIEDMFKEETKDINEIMEEIKEKTSMEIIARIDNTEIIGLKINKEEASIEPKVDPNKISESNITSQNKEAHKKEMNEVRKTQANKSKTIEPNHESLQNDIPRTGKKRKRKNT
jgi:hypothetical protein